jgi:hypothetical protein
MSLDYGIEAIYIQCYYWQLPVVSHHFYFPVFSFTYSLFTGLLAQKGVFFLEFPVSL